MILLWNQNLRYVETNQSQSAVQERNLSIFSLRKLLRPFHVCKRQFEMQYLLIVHSAVHQWNAKKWRFYFLLNLIYVYILSIKICFRFSTNRHLGLIGVQLFWVMFNWLGLILTLIEWGSWMLLESGGLNQPAPSRSPQNTVKNHFFFWFSESS